MDIDLDSTLLVAASSYLFRALLVFAIIAAAWLGGRWVARLIQTRMSEFSHVDPTVASFGANLARWAAMGLALLLCLNVFGVAATSLAALLGAAGVAIGLAFQGSLSNLAAGVLLLMVRPFQVGDFVEVADESGEVTSVGLVVTQLLTVDHELITIPNRLILDASVENLTARPQRRFAVPVGVAYGTDLDRARSALEAAAEAVHDPSEKRKAVVALTGFGGSSIDWTVRVWGPARDWIRITDRLVAAIERELAAAEIEIPFPQRVLHLQADGMPDGWQISGPRAAVEPSEDALH